MGSLHARSSSVFPFFVLSLILYLLVIVSIFLYIKSDDELIKRYSSKKDNLLQIAIVEKTKTPKVIKQVKKKPKQEAVKKKKEVKPRTAKKEDVGIKSLFGMTTKDINKTKISKSSKKNTAKRSRLKSHKSRKYKKSNKATKLVNSLQFETSPDLPRSASVGEYDEFRGKVQEILTEYWNEIEDMGIIADANVKIKIDKNGNFSYNIVNLSYNREFNNKFKDFLESMKEVKFPENFYNIDIEPIKFSSKWSNADE